MLREDKQAYHHPLLEKLMNEIWEVVPNIGIQGICKRAGIQPSQLRFGNPKAAKPPCGQGVILGLCQGVKACDYDHSYHCTDEEARNVLQLIGDVPNK